MPRCGACKAVYYCSVECQKADWKKHKKECGTAQKAKKKDTSKSVSVVEKSETKRKKDHQEKQTHVPRLYLDFYKVKFESFDIKVAEEYDTADKNKEEIEEGYSPMVIESLRYDDWGDACLEFSIKALSCDVECIDDLTEFLGPETETSRFQRTKDGKRIIVPIGQEYTLCGPTPKSLHAEIPAKVWREIGNGMFIKGDYKLAAVAYQRVLQLTVSEVEQVGLLYSIAGCYIKLGRYHEGLLFLADYRLRNHGKALRLQARTLFKTKNLIMTACCARADTKAGGEASSEDFDCRMIHSILMDEIPLAKDFSVAFERSVERRQDHFNLACHRGILKFLLHDLFKREWKWLDSEFPRENWAGVMSKYDKDARAHGIAEKCQASDMHPSGLGTHLFALKMGMMMMGLKPCVFIQMPSCPAYPKAWFEQVYKPWSEDEENALRLEVFKLQVLQPEEGKDILNEGIIIYRGDQENSSLFPSLFDTTINGCRADVGGFNGPKAATLQTLALGLPTKPGSLEWSIVVKPNENYVEKLYGLKKGTVTWKMANYIPLVTWTTELSNLKGIRAAGDYYQNIKKSFSTMDFEFGMLIRWTQVAPVCPTASIAVAFAACTDPKGEGCHSCAIGAAYDEQTLNALPCLHDADFNNIMGTVLENWNDDLETKFRRCTVEELSKKMKREGAASNPCCPEKVRSRASRRR